MLSLDRRMSFDVEFNRVAIAVAEMLSREMDDVALYLGQGGGSDFLDASHRTAKAAKRIVVLCRRLAGEIRRYEYCDRLRREIQDGDTPF